MIGSRRSRTVTSERKRERRLEEGADPGRAAGGGEDALMAIFDRFRRGREAKAQPSRPAADARPAPDPETREPGTLPLTGRQAAWAAAWVRTFDAVLELCPRADGGAWTGESIERASAGRVPAAYFEGLLRGRVYAPTEERLGAIAEAFGLPSELLGREVAWWEGVRARHRRGVELGEAIRRAEVERDAERIGRLARELFELVPNKATGEPFTAEQVAAIRNEHARGPEEELRPEDLRAICGSLSPEPARWQLLALCDVFDVDFSYWREEPDRPGRLDPLFDSILSGGRFAAMPGGELLVDAVIQDLSRREKVVLKPD